MPGMCGVGVFSTAGFFRRFDSVGICTCQSSSRVLHCCNLSFSASSFSVLSNMCEIPRGNQIEFEQLAACFTPAASWFAIAGGSDRHIVAGAALALMAPEQRAAASDHTAGFPRSGEECKSHQLYRKRCGSSSAARTSQRGVRVACSIGTHGFLHGFGIV